MNSPPSFSRVELSMTLSNNAATMSPVGRLGYAERIFSKVPVTSEETLFRTDIIKFWSVRSSYWVWKVR